MPQKCSLCGSYIANIPYASFYREHGFCPDHLPDDLQCAEENCTLPVANSEYCQRHSKKLYKARNQFSTHECGAMTKNGTPCKRLIHDGTKYCNHHRKEKTVQAKEYTKYIRGMDWDTKRKYIYAKYDQRCAICNRYGITLHAHHRTYQRLGDEYENDIISLCADCHYIFHQFYYYYSNDHTFKPKNKHIFKRKAKNG